jgi:hypothetical protein
MYNERRMLLAYPLVMAMSTLVTDCLHPFLLFHGSARSTLTHSHTEFIDILINIVTPVDIFISLQATTAKGRKSQNVNRKAKLQYKRSKSELKWIKKKSRN